MMTGGRGVMRPRRMRAYRHRERTRAKGIATFILGIVVASTVAGCGDRGARAGDGVVIDTLAGGVVRVTSPIEGRWGPGEGWVLEEELRIGDTDGGGPATFGNITGIAVDARGRIFVLDNQARELRIFDADGTHLRTVGREGEGPGEFLLPTGIAIHPGEGTVWVVDARANRYSVFDSGGEFLETRIRPTSFISFPWPGGFTDDGSLVDLVLVAGSGSGRQAIVRLDSEFMPTDTIPLPEVEARHVRVMNAEGQPVMTVPQPFSPLLRWRFDPTGGGHLWWGVSDRVHLTREGFDGGAERIVRRDHLPVPITRAEADEERARWEEIIARNLGPAGGGRVDGSLDSPPFKPAFETFLVDDAGRLWVEPFRPADATARHLHVFDTDGAFLGAVEIDTGFSTVVVFTGDRIHAVVTDELGVPSIVRYRIR